MPNISLVTYAGQTVTPLDDALVYETAINQSGMIYGGTVTIKNANNLHISSGHGMVCGRKFTIFESDIQVALSSSGTLLGRLYVQLDLSNVGTPVQLLVETGASLTPVVQEKNVNIMNGVYEFNLATFTVDTSTISNIVNVAPSAEPSTGAGSVITITTSEASLQGKMCTITDGTTTLNANFDNTGTAIFYGVQMVGTVIVNATDGTYYASGQITITYFGKYSTSIAFWGATVNLSTTTPEFYGQTISITQDGILVGTTSFDGSGSATYIAPAVGTYIFTVTYGGNDYSATVNVASQTTYSATINQNNGLTLDAWITAGSTTEYPLNPSSYADFAALEADEAAVRQLMTVHASVDYLAQATAGDSLMESVIGSDVCAKWINLSDYALDTLSANSDIKSVMDTADKYGYGEWIITDSTTTPVTWGAKGNVPIMTANDAPYGVASAYQVFDGNSSTSASGTDFSYQSVNPICVKSFDCDVSGGTLQGSNDGSTYTDISTPASNTTYYMYHRAHFASSQTVHTLQFYGRELKPLVPTMTSNTTPKGEAFAKTNNANAYKAFDGNSSNSPWNGTAISSTVGTDYVGYECEEQVTVRYISYQQVASGAVSRLIDAPCKLEYSTDGTTYQSAGTFNMSASANEGNASISTSAKAKHWRVFYDSPNYKYTASEYYFYMAEMQFFGMDYSEKEFASGSTRKTIYDHGVELETIGTSDTSHKGADALVVSCGASSSGNTYGLTYGDTVNMSDYDTIYATVGQRAYSSAQYIQVQAQTGITSYNDGRKAYQAFGNGSKYLSLDIASVMESARPTLTTNLSSLCEIVEWWLE